MIRASLAVESRILTLEEISSKLERDPDSGHEMGSPIPIPIRAGVLRVWSLWEIALPIPVGQHPGTEGISSAIELLDGDLADRIAILVAAKHCEAVVSVVQELSSSDTSESGFHLSATALSWMARAQAALDLDQYVVLDDELD